MIHDVTYSRPDGWQDRREKQLHGSRAEKTSTGMLDN